MVVEPNFDSHVMVNSVGVVSWGTENQLCSFTRHQFRAKVWIAEELTYHIIEFYSMIQQLEDTNWDHALKNTGSAVAQCDTLVSRIWNVVPGGGSHSSSIPPPCSTWATPRSTPPPSQAALVCFRVSWTDACNYPLILVAWLTGGGLEQCGGGRMDRGV
jgi:hypothetical protein